VGKSTSLVGLALICLAIAFAIVTLPRLAAAHDPRRVNYYNWSDYQDPTVLDTF
jgi:spermidine/putrescine-binding protein